MTEPNDPIKQALAPLLEAEAHGDVQISIAISLKRISDRMAEAQAQTQSPPKILHRGVK
jgi:hypothetical protein